MTSARHIVREVLARLDTWMTAPRLLLLVKDFLRIITSPQLPGAAAVRL